MSWLLVINNDEKGFKMIKTFLSWPRSRPRLLSQDQDQDQGLEDYITGLCAWEHWKFFGESWSDYAYGFICSHSSFKIYQKKDVTYMNNCNSMTIRCFNLMVDVGYTLGSLGTSALDSNMPSPLWYVTDVRYGTDIRVFCTSSKLFTLY